jgi:ADP-heptose:LPS heptosyltransferase
MSPLRKLRPFSGCCTNFNKDWRGVDFKGQGVDILVINLMRLGDLIQATPVLRRLRTEYPGSTVTLVVMDLFLETARLLPGVDRLVPFPSANLAAALDQAGGWPVAAHRLAEWLAQNFPRPPDLVLNLTPNRVGAILAYATGAAEIRVMAVDPSWELNTCPDWASYALIVSRARQANPFNLVDLFLRESGLTPDGQGLELTVPQSAEQEAENFLGLLNLPADAALVGLLPGASQPERQWPPERFAQAALLLREKRPCHFFIFGSTGEAPLGEAIARRLPATATTLLLGRTSLAVLAAHLKRLDLLITNDTGPMHLAAAAATPNVALFLASARVQDTGPVGMGHVILEPQLDCHPCPAPCPQLRCHQAITPAAVSRWANTILNREPLAPVAEVPSWDTMRIYFSGIDPHGYHAYLPLVRRPLRRRDFWLWLQRAVWGEVLDGPAFPAPPLKQWLENILQGHYLPPREDLGLGPGQTCLSELDHIAGQGEQIAREIIHLAGYHQAYPAWLWQKIEGLRVVDQELRRVGVAFPELAAMVEFYFQGQRDKQGTEIIPLARELEGAYARLRRLAGLALEHLAELKMILGIQGKNDDPAKMAWPVQARLANNEAIQPESEGPPCR